MSDWAPFTSTAPGGLEDNDCRIRALARAGLPDPRPERQWEGKRLAGDESSPPQGRNELCHRQRVRNPCSHRHRSSGGASYLLRHRSGPHGRRAASLPYSHPRTGRAGGFASSQGKPMRAAGPARGPAFGVARPRPLDQDFQAAPAGCGSGGFGSGRASPDAHRPVAIDDAARCTPLTGGFRRAPTVRCPAVLLAGEARGLAACSSVDPCAGLRLSADP